MMTSSMADSPMRVVLVAPTLGILGGHSVQAATLLAGWRGDPSIDMRLVPTNPPPMRRALPLHHLKYVRTAMTQLQYWPMLLQAVRRADIVHVFAASNGSFFVAALPAILVASAAAVPVVIHHHGDDPERLLSMPAARRLIRSAALNVVPSRYFALAFERRGIPAVTIPNVADLQRFRYRMRDPLRPTLLSTRNLEPVYNVACTLRAFGHLHRRHPDASLTILGSGSEERALRSLVQSLDLRGVTFAGRVGHDAIHHWYDRADIYVQSPREDNMPCSIQEAFASGTPVVATRVGGVPVMLEHGVHGLLAPSDDDVTLAAHMAALLDHPDAARSLAEAAFARSQAYGWSVVREQWREAYRGVRERQRRPAQAA